MVSFIRARTGETVKEKGDALKARVLELRNKPLSIQLGLEPDGYQAWLGKLQPATADEAPMDATPPPNITPPPPAPVVDPPVPVAATVPTTLPEANVPMCLAQSRARRVPTEN